MASVRATRPKGTVSPASLTFTTANWNTPQTVTITGVNDTQADGNVAYTIVTAAATSTDAGYQGRDADNVSVTNTDDEQIALRIVRTNHGSEAGPAAGLFTVTQTNTSTVETRVAYSIAGTATAGSRLHGPERHGDDSRRADFRRRFPSPC